MPYIIRSVNGLVLSQEDKEKVFPTKEAAEEERAFLQQNTSLDWTIIPLNET
ncbi:hypothetical protein [Planococcus lenghuensis]|uniref:hypothetical protein n=1 Tax=Planococcus lenghuensis TaxID=2213202 RepID=UPI0012EB8618|nr:hypothetical protein [Planococcus lenghuensis]